MQSEACRVAVETSSGMHNDSSTPLLSDLEYCHVKVEGLDESFTALKDSGAQILDCDTPKFDICRNTPKQRNVGY